MDRKSRLQKGIRNLKDAYIDYAGKLLEQYPEYWSKYKNKTPHYQIFRHEGFKIVEVISYERYKTIVHTWFRGSKQYIIDGQILILGSGLGKIAGRRVERNFKKKVVDWEATEAWWKEKGERKGLIYNLEPDWVRVGWKKTKRVKNCFLYRFAPMHGNITGKGFKKEFSKANKLNPNLKYQYEFFPYLKTELEDEKH